MDKNIENLRVYRYNETLRLKKVRVIDHGEE